ncbi:fluoride efflux transporter CrcB [Paenarthrobacter nicotinovorans]|uniref:fluoride efflux transporter CrcB n=1 Tax=Paenarthrobacter nicotinovorans TaxID=29320 RepID=UPI00380ABFEC
MNNVLFGAAVMVCGATAALVRYAVTILAVRAGHNSLTTGYPYPVLIVNAVGSLIAGLAIGAASAGVIPSSLQTLLVTGVAGGLTTFSTFSVETLQLLMRGRYKTAVSSVVVNLAVGLALAAVGYTVGRSA